VWQKERSEHVSASGRSHGETSTASTRRLSAARGGGAPTRARRSRATSIRPWFRAREEGRIGVIYGFQNSVAVGRDLERVAEFARLGVRVVQLTSNPQRAPTSTAGTD
jgi:microsomal dipeptidase-like Zn-dependent dipeptidase